MADETKSYPGPGSDEYTTTFSSKGNPDEDPGHGKVIVNKDGRPRYARETQERGGQEGTEDSE